MIMGKVTELGHGLTTARRHATVFHSSSNMSRSRFVAGDNLLFRRSTIPIVRLTSGECGRFQLRPTAWLGWEDSNSQKTIRRTAINRRRKDSQR